MIDPRTGRRSFLKRCLGLAVAPLVPLPPAKAAAVTVDGSEFGLVPRLMPSGEVRYCKPGIYGEFVTISAEQLLRHRTATLHVYPVDITPAEEPTP